MRVWRICRKPHAKDALRGRGGLLASGRWHSRGRPVVYTSRSLALAALEVLVQVDREIAPADLVQIEIDIPDDLEVLSWGSADLPRNWRSYPAPPALQRRGDAWLSEATTPLLCVPSALIPEELNYLLNPMHPDAGRVSVVSSKRFAFDRRLLP